MLFLKMYPDKFVLDSLSSVSLAVLELRDSFDVS
jgi:hypothetical protein